MDQGLFSAPHGLSQSITSFIASYCLGIHQTPFSRLIRSRKSKACFVVLSPGGLLEDKEQSSFLNRKSYVFPPPFAHARLMET